MFKALALAPALLAVSNAHLKILFPPSRGSEGSDEGFNESTADNAPCGGFSPDMDGDDIVRTEIPMTEGQIQLLPTHGEFNLHIALGEGDTYDLDIVPNRQVNEEPILLFEYESLGVDPGEYTMQFIMTGDDHEFYWCSDVVVVESEVEIPEIPEEVRDFVNEKFEEQGLPPLHEEGSEGEEGGEHEGHSHGGESEGEGSELLPSSEEDAAGIVQVSSVAVVTVLVAVLA